MSLMHEGRRVLQLKALLQVHAEIAVLAGRTLNWSRLSSIRVRPSHGGVYVTLRWRCTSAYDPSGRGVLASGSGREIPVGAA